MNEGILPKIDERKVGGFSPDVCAVFGDVDSEMLAVFVDQSLDCIKLISPGGTVEYMNRNGLCAMEIDNFSNIFGKTWASLWPIESRALVAKSLIRANKGEDVRFEAFCPTFKGTPRWWDVSVSSVSDSDGKRIGYLSISRDVTEARAALEAAQASEERIKSLQTRLLESARVNAMGTLAATFAHELNQPLAAITNYAEGIRIMLGRNVDRAALDLSADAILKCALRSGDLIKSVREMLNRDVGIKDRINPDEIVRGAVAFALNGSSASTKVDLDLAHGACVFADPFQIEQVLINLIKNACDAVRDCERKEISVSTCILDNQVKFEVRDTGHGIAPHHLTSLFDAFVTTKRDATGIGLSISRTIVEAHRGKIWAESLPDGGASFHFTLPMSAPDDLLRAAD